MPAGGRKPGQVNKITRNMKDVILLAFDRQGGVRYLEKVAKNDPKTFCHLLGRVIPTEVAVSLTTVDLGAEMRLAAERLDRLNEPKDITPTSHVTLEHEATPHAKVAHVKVAHVKVARAKVAHVKVIEDNMAIESEKVKRVSRKKRQVERVKKK